MRIVLLGAVLALCACGETVSGAPSEAAASTCALRDGTYAVNWTQSDPGTCGVVAATPPSTEVIGSDAGPSASPGCTGGSAPSADRCSDSFVETCPATGWAESGTVTWSADGSEGSGTIAATFTRTDGSTCSTTYTVSYVR